MTTDTQTLPTPVLWERPVHTRLQKHTNNFWCSGWLSYLMYVCSSVLVCSSRRLLGKRPGHGRVQQRVPEAPAPVWPRTRLSGPGQVGECNVAVMRERERGKAYSEHKELQVTCSAWTVPCGVKSNHMLPRKTARARIRRQLGQQFALYFIKDTCFNRIPETEGAAVIWKNTLISIFANFSLAQLKKFRCLFCV